MANKKIKVLYVNNTVKKLATFGDKYSKRYKVYTTSSVEEAMTILQKEEIHFVMADQPAKGDSGLKFLSRVKATHPDVLRILFTKQTVVDDIVRSITRLNLFRCISKPWKQQELIELFEEGYTVYCNNKEQKRKIHELTRVNEQLEFMLRQKLIS